MSKNNNQKVKDLFVEMDCKEFEAYALRQKARDCELVRAQRKDDIYNAIFDVLPKNPDEAILAREAVKSLSDNWMTQMRLMGMLTGTAHYDSQFPDCDSSHIMKHKKTFCTYSIKCDENGNPIPGAIPIEHKREKNVYWYK